jgi:E3 ubiquitin-protein ligase RFWD2
LTSNGDYLACGSEDNAVYVYYKTLEKPIVMHTCNTVAEGVSPEQKNFVSSVAWRKQSDVILAANSLGIIHLLRLK